MRGLGARVVLSFWIASTLIGGSFVVIDGLTSPHAFRERRQNLVRDAIRYEASAILEDAAHGDVLERLEAFEAQTDVTLFLFRADGSVLSTRPPSASVRRVAARVSQEDDVETHLGESARLVAFALPAHDAVVVGRIRRIPTWARALGLSTLGHKVVVLVLISGLVSLVLARLLTRPLDHLRDATRRIAAGDLSARVLPALSGSTREVEALASDFDRMAARVEQLMSAQQRLLSDVSHELNSPLARLRVALELAREEPAEHRGRALDRIGRDVDRLEALVRQVLTLSRLDLGGPLAQSDVDVAELARAIGQDADFEARATQRSVRVTADVEAHVWGDAELLRRAIENVVRNAIRFTEAGTEVELELFAEPHELRIEVRDRGPGIPEHALGEVFSPLFRLQADRDRRTGGSGLGLAITARAVAAHGGSVRAANREGGGLVMTLRLPREPRGRDLTNPHESIRDA